MLAVILMGLLTSETPSEAAFAILHGQLQMAIVSIAHRLAMEQFFMRPLDPIELPYVEKRFIIFFHRLFQIHLISPILNRQEMTSVLQHDRRDIVMQAKRASPGKWANSALEGNEKIENMVT